MKKSLLLSVLSFICISHASSQVPNIEIFRGKEKDVIPITVIDSITYDNDGTSFNQIIWNKGREYKTHVNDVNQISITSEGITYKTFEAKEHGIESGIINSLGQFAAAGKDTISNNGVVILIGDIYKEEPQFIIHVDSFRLVRYVYCENFIYRYFYGENDFTVLTLNEEGDSINCETYAYALFQDPYAKSRIASKAGGTISNSGWFNLLNLVDIGSSLRNPTNSTLLSNWASMQENPLLSYGGDAAVLAFGPWYSKALVSLKWIDNLWNFWVFRGTKITTLPHEELSIDKVRLSCRVDGLNKIPRIRNFEAYAICTMKLRAWSGNGADPNEYMNWQIKERNINSDGVQSFDFDNLLLESQYQYQPQLNLAWTEAEARIYVDVEGDSDTWTIITEEKKSFQSIRGNEETFWTSKPKVSTGEPQYVWVTDAVVGCHFSDVPSEASCGVECTGGGVTYLVSAENNTTTGDESYVVIDGLKPNTKYTYRAFVDTKYKMYYGKYKDFTTKKPSCSTGEVVSKTDKSAVVKCSYYLADGFECGVMVSSDSGSKKFTTSSEDGERSISLSGLTPSTTYNYWAYVLIDGVPENGEVKSFTTKAPPTPIATTGGYSDVTTNSAIVECSFENVPEGGKCYVYLHWIDDWGYKMDNSFSSSEGINKKITCSGLTPATTYYYTATISYDGNEYNGEEKSFTTKGRNLCPDENHPHAIDLGLPSGTKWCCCNLGASRPEDCGGYYTWDEIQQLEEPWSVPEWRLISELVYECYWVQYTKINGVDGYYFKAKNKNELFLPAAGVLYNSEPYNPERGYYWSSDPDDVPAHKDDAIYYWFDYWGHDINHMYRGTHLSVRPICQ